MANHELRRELVAFFPDLGRCSDKRLADAEGKRSYHSICLIDVSSLLRIVRIQNSSVGVIDLKGEWGEKRKRYTHNFWI
jgi:hypothetical protein